MATLRKTGKIAGASGDLQNAVGAAFDITIPSGVKYIAENLFSRAAEEGSPGIEGTQEINRNENSGLNIVENAMWGVFPNKGETDPDNPIPTPNCYANCDIRKITMYDIESLDSYAFYGCDILVWKAEKRLVIMFLRSVKIWEITVM